MSQHQQNNCFTEDSTYLSSPIEVKDNLCFFAPRRISSSAPESPNGLSAEMLFSPILPVKLIYPLQLHSIKKNGFYEAIAHHSDQWMDLACEIALDSVKVGGGPFGAIILQIDKESNRILRYWRTHNQVTQINDPTAHAEVLCIRSACRSLGVYDLSAIEAKAAKLPQPSSLSYCVIYSSSEPCPMCYAAINWAKIPCLFFAATRFDAAVPGVEFSDEELYKELSLSYADRKTKVCQCASSKALDAFNLWKNIPHKEY